MRLPTASRALRQNRRAQALNRFLPHSLSPSPAVQACDAESVGRPSRFTKAGETHAVEHFLRFRETLNRIRKISVRAADAGEHCSDSRQNLFEVEPIEMADDSLGLAEVEDPAFASRPQHAGDLAQAGIVVGKIAEAEG